MIYAMISDEAQETNAERIRRFGRRAIAGEQLNREEALWLFGLESSADIGDLLAAANRVREHFKGNKIHLCSIVNAKAGGCSEDCKFCAQSALWQGASPRYGFVDKEPVEEAAKEAKRNGVTAVGLVAAWKGLKGHLVFWADPRHSLPLLPKGPAYQNEFITCVEVSLQTPLSALGEIVNQVVQPLFEIFDGFVLSKNVVEELTRGVLETRS